jgi:hypothetical protein
MAVSISIRILVSYDSIILSRLTDTYRDDILIWWYLTCIPIRIVVSLVFRYKNNTIRSHTYAKKIWTRRHGKLKTESDFVVLRLT